MNINSHSTVVQKPALWILVILAAVSPLTINLFVPSIPSIAAEMNAPYASVQLGLSIYLLFTAPVSLIAGPVSDKFGRRPVLLVALVIFLIGSLICTFAPNTTLFLIGRVIQTSSAAGMILSRAIVRDVYPREKSASMIGYVVMGMAVAPMIGPAIGGLIDSFAGWRWSFGILVVFGGIALVATAVNLPETNPNIGQSSRQQFQAYKTLLKMPLFWLFTMAASLSSAIFFAFLGGGPAVSSVFFGQTPFEYGLYFSLCAIGYAVGNGLSGRLSEQVGVEGMMSAGAVIGFIGPALSLSLFMLSTEPASWMLFFPMTLVGIGNGMTLPNVTSATISIKPEAAGAASGLLGALQIGVGGVASVAGALAAGETGSPFALCTLIGIIALVALAVTVWSARISVPEAQTSPTH